MNGTGWGLKHEALLNEEALQALRDRAANALLALAKSVSLEARAEIEKHENEFWKQWSKWDSESYLPSWLP